MSLKRMNSAVRVGTRQWFYLRSLSEKTEIPAATLLKLAIEDFRTKSKIGRLVDEESM